VPTACGPQRLCQKCKRLHPLAAFTGDKCCCDATLAALRQQRRAAGAADAVPPGAGSTAAADAPDAPAAGSPAAEWLEDAFAAFMDELLPSGGGSVQPDGAGSDTGRPPPPLPLPPPPQPACAAAAWPWELPWRASAVLKLPAVASPVVTLARTGLRAEALPTGGAAGGAPAQLLAAVRPGCTLLSLDALLLVPLAVPPRAPHGVASSWLAPGAGGAAAALTALLAAAPRLAAQARLPGGVRLELPCSAAVAFADADAGPGAPARVVAAAAAAPHSAAAAAQQPPRLHPRALLSTRAGELLLEGAPPCEGCVRVWLRVNGQYLAASATAAAAANGALRVALPTTGVSGAAVLELDGGGGTGCAVLLLTADAKVAAEVAAGGGAMSAAEVERAVWGVGCALALVQAHVARGTPRGARAAIAAAGAAAAIRCGWTHALRACLAAAVAADAAARDGDNDDEDAVHAVRAAGSGACLLHQAVSARSAAALEAVLRGAPASLRGSALTPDARGVTPLQAAARTGDARLVTLLCATDRGGSGGGADAASEGADAALGWLAAPPGSGAAADVALLRRVHAGARLALAAAAAAAPGAAARAVLRRQHAAALALAQLRALEPAASAAAADAAHVAAALLRRFSSAAAHADAAADAAAAAVAAAPASPHSLRALRSTVLLVLCYRAFCLVWSTQAQPLPEAEILQALPPRMLTWAQWRRMPTAMCCLQRSNGGVDAHTVAAAATAAAAAAAAFLPGAAARLRGRRAAAAHVALVAWVLVLDPCACALRTYARYGAGLRQPWQAGVRTLCVLATVHVSTEQRLPARAYGVLLGARAAALALTLALEGAPVLGQLRLLTACAAWDAAHAAALLACAAHTHTVQRRRAARRAADAGAAARQPQRKDKRA
jgi:hypothetical protein